MSLDPSENFETARLSSVAERDIRRWDAELAETAGPASLVNLFIAIHVRVQCSHWGQAGDELTAEELDSVKDVESKFPVRADLNKKIAIW